MEQLTAGQRQHLRRLAHELRPIVQIGKQGLTNQVLTTVAQAIEYRELIKVKFIGVQEEKQRLAQELAAGTDSILIGLIGNVVILYREQPDPERRTITFPL